MQPAKTFTARMAIYSLAVLYLAGDLFVFKGPLHRRIQAARPDSPEAFAAAREQGIVARVGGRPIFLSQVERATIERLWLRGRGLDDLTPAQRRLERLAALNHLIDHELLRTKVLHNMDSVPVADAEIDAAVKRLAARFATREEMRTELAAEGIDSEKELRYRLAARIQQQRYIESRLAEHLAISDDEARAWFEENRSRFDHPPRVRARHVFLATLNRDPETARATLEAALADLTAGTRDFARLAAELSDDYRTRHSGGDLDWMTADRLPDDFATPVFAMEKNRPQLIRTRIGWHLVEVTDRLPATPRDFDDAREEVLAALESARRIEMVGRLRHALRHDPNAVTVHTFPDLIPEE